jgi:hypothetical protein
MTSRRTPAAVRSAMMPCRCSTSSVVALFAGAVLGDRLQRYPCEDCIEGAFYGALVGESLAIPLGVHLADRRQGNAGIALATSVAIGALGLGAAAATDEWRLLLAIPVAQIATSIMIERHTARDLDP